MGHRRHCGDILAGVPIGTPATRLNAAQVPTVGKRHASGCPNNAKGRKTRDDCGCPWRGWDPTTIKEMMVNPRLVGKRAVRSRESRRKYDAPPVVTGDALWPAILDVDTWEKIRVRLTDAKRRCAVSLPASSTAAGAARR